MHNVLKHNIIKLKGALEKPRRPLAITSASFYSEKISTAYFKGISATKWAQKCFFWRQKGVNLPLIYYIIEVAEQIKNPLMFQTPCQQMIDEKCFKGVVTHSNPLHHPPTKC